MSATPDSTLADPQQVIAHLQRQLAASNAERDEAQQRLAERTAEHDEALEQQTATAEVLQVINSSPGDLTPVFEAVLRKATRLCEAAFGGLTTFDGKQFLTLAMQGLSQKSREIFRESFTPSPGSFHYRLAHGESVVHGDHLENPSL